MRIGLVQAPGLFIDALLDRLVRPIRLRSSIRHVHGPEAVPCSRDEVIVICVIRNGGLYIDQFVEHHLGLGAKHIVFLDNGSTDETLRSAARHDRVTVVQSHLPYSKFENHMKTYLARRFSRDRWNLCCDIDEMFDYPFSDRVTLGRLVAYLDTRGFTAVVAQMLDLFSDQPLPNIRDDPSEIFGEKYVYYDLDDLMKYDYTWSELSFDGVRMHHGGIRRSLFGTNNGLTKAALVLVRDDIRLFQGWHHAINARIADFTCVLRHYPFTGAFYRKAQEAAKSGRYGRVTTDEYRNYWMTLASCPDISFKRPSARVYSGPAQLLEEGFLVASPEYLGWAASQPLPGPNDRLEPSPDGLEDNS